MLGVRCIKVLDIITKIKTDKKEQPKKRRVYISLERDILDAMDKPY